MLFGLIKPNDWKIVHKEKSYFVLIDRYTGAKIQSDRPFYAYLKYSKSRNKYKIESSTYVFDFENGSAYQKCLSKQMLLENDH